MEDRIASFVSVSSSSSADVILAGQIRILNSNRGPVLLIDQSKSAARKPNLGRLSAQASSSQTLTSTPVN
jgi:hypothetical protein